MIPLALPTFDYKIKKISNKIYILDPVRKKYVLLTPEEWVRQHVLHYLIHHLSYPKGLCRLEKRVCVGPRHYRPDILLCDNFGIIKMVVECKAPHTSLTNQVLGQVVHYNRQLGASYLLITNGIMHFCWKWNQESDRFYAINHIPIYQNFMSKDSY